MDGTGPGEPGVLAWCNSIRFSVAKDAGREFLDTQIQKQGFDFLESYLDNVFSRAKEEYVVAIYYCMVALTSSEQAYVRAPEDSGQEEGCAEVEQRLSSSNEAGRGGEVEVSLEGAIIKCELLLGNYETNCRWL